MGKKNQYYYSKSPDVKLKTYTISESLRRHLYIFKTITGVFSFKKLDLGTKILIEHMNIPKNPGTFLDMGCGYGPIGIVLGQESPRSKIYFTEINRRAIWCVKENVKINLPDSKSRIKILSGNYFEQINKKNIKFDGIYANPPLRLGKQEFLNVYKEVPHYLEPNGFFEFVIMKKMGAASLYSVLKEIFPKSNVEILCKRSGYWVFHCSFS